MNALLLPFRVLYKIYYLLVFLVSLTLFYPFFRYLLAKKSRFPKAFELKKVWALVLQIFAGIILRIEHRGQLPKDQPYVICPNHGSYLDIVFMYRLFKDYFVFMGKKEIASWPLFRIFFTREMNITVDRASRTGSHKAFKRAAADIQKGHSVVIFPEGTISTIVPKLRPFKNGAFKLAIEQQVPIVPVTFVNNWERLEGHGLFDGKAGPGIAHVIIHEPIATKGMSDDDVSLLRAKVREIIDQPLKERYEN